MSYPAHRQTDRQNEQQTEKQQRLHNSTFHSKNAAHILTVCGADKVATGQSLSLTGHGKEQIHLPQCGRSLFNHLFGLNV